MRSELPIFQGSEKKRVEQLKRFIVNHLNQKLAVPVLVKMVGMNEKRLNRWFKKLYGMNVHAYILSTRMQTALFFLRNTDELVKTVSLNCGYKDTKSFTRSFKMFFGYPPSLAKFPG